MGNQQSDETSSPKNSIRRSESKNTELQPRIPTKLIPLEYLAKILVQKSLEEESIHGISCKVFCKNVFLKYPRLGERIYNRFVSLSPPTSKHLCQAAFRQQAEKLMTGLSNEQQVEYYLKCYGENGDVKRDDLQELITTAYDLAMNHHPKGPQSCPLGVETLQAVLNSAFQIKTQMSVTYLSRWIMEHCPRILVGVYRYTVHQLTTSYRFIGKDVVDRRESVDISTPVLDKEVHFLQEVGPVLPISQVWLLACTLPQIYTQPSIIQSPSEGNGLSSLASESFISRFVGSVCPSHWVFLYNSEQHGMGANRFSHHVFNYRGPTLVFIRGQEGVEFCIASPDEWTQTHMYWGQAECMVMQILPHFHVIERGPKLLYLNTTIRGYPKGIRAGSDPRKPALIVDDGFTVVTYLGIPYPITSVEVWGAGTLQSRKDQMDVKKWEVKQAEKMRKVKITASDWIDNPDRYLLELAGRENYNNSS